MGILHGVVATVGRALRKARAGEDKLAAKRLNAIGTPTIDVTSPAFKAGGAIPRRYATQGANVSPPLKFRGIPREAEEIVVLCEDPDAPLFRPFAHWIVTGISPSVTELPEGLEEGPVLSSLPGARQGKNTKRRVAYDGPSPPAGHGEHRYHFQVFALNRPLPTSEIPIDREELVEQLRDRVIGFGEIVGVYQKP
ncbi:MAG: YbhB/YbcL family Raf kinase inhibitor-like protein [Polyangiaceae bacterium]|nr:YbhB/YbcL family Raf kinase inhibitor-like protein [Polyangiaceae bacterium]